jgi:hypothetical protein
VRVQQGKAMVQVREGDTAVQKEVQVGLRTQQQVEVLSGLNEGDKVIQTIIRPQTTTAGFGLFGGGGNRNQQQNQASFPQGGGGNANSGAGNNANGANRQRNGNANGNGR